MAEQRVITKQLAGAEDLLRGIGTVTQKRGTGDKTITKLNASELQGAIVVDTIADMTALVTDDLGDTKTVIVKDNDRGGVFHYDSTRKGENDDGIVFDGWVRQYDGAVNFDWFKVSSTDNTEEMLAALKVNGKVKLGKNNIIVLKNLSLDTYFELDLNGGTIFGASDSAFLNCSSMKISNGTIGDNSGYYSYSCISWTSSDILNVTIDNILFQGGNITERLVQATAGDVVKHKTISITNCRFNGFTRSGIELNTTAFGSALEYIKIDNCIAHGVQIESGTKRAFQIGSNTDRANTVIVTNCKIFGMSGSGTYEVKGILVYGDDVLIDGNSIEDVYNTGGDDAEGIYVKATNARIVNNFLKNAGSSHDGCITVKGTDDTGEQLSEKVIIANNTIELTGDKYDVIGIEVTRPYCIISNNTLKDLRPNRSSLSHSTAIGIGTSSYVSYITISNNIITGFNWVFGDTLLPANVIDNIIISDNICINNISGVSRFRSDANIQGTDWNFNSVTKTITLGLYAGIYKPMIDSGTKVIISGTSSNNGVYTVDTVIDSTHFTVLETLVDETNTGVSRIILEQAGTISIVNNTFKANANLGTNFLFEFIGDSALSSIIFSNNTINDYYRVANFITPLRGDEFYNISNVGNTTGYTGADNANITEGNKQYGIFTPIFNSGTDDISYTSQIGEYQIDGDNVTMQLELKWDSATFNGNTLQIDLPLSVEIFGAYNIIFKGKTALYSGGLKASSNDFSTVARNNYIRFMSLNGDTFFDGNQIFDDTAGGITIQIEFKLS